MVVCARVCSLRQSLKELPEGEEDPSFEIKRTNGQKCESEPKHSHEFRKQRRSGGVLQR